MDTRGKNNIISLFFLYVLFLFIAMIFPALSFTTGCSKSQERQMQKIDSRPTYYFGQMHTVGPGGGGWIGYPTINPQDPANITISCDMGSTFISQNGTSDDFYFLQPRLNADSGSVVQYFYNPKDADIVYALAAGQAYISRDKGRTWSFFAPKEDNIAGVIGRIIYKTDQHFVKEGSTHNRNSTDFYLFGLYVDPSDTTSNTIYIVSYSSGFYLNTPTGYRNLNVTEVYRTKDGGNTWTRITRILDAPGGHWTQDLNRYARMIMHNGYLHLMTTGGMFIIDPNIPNILDSLVYRNDFRNLGAQYLRDGNELYMYMFVHLTEPTRREIRKYRYTDKAYDTTNYTVITQDFKKRLYNWYGENNTLQDGNPASFDRFDVVKNATSITVYVTFKSAPTKNNKWNVDGVAVSHDDGLKWTRALEGCGENVDTYNNTSYYNVSHAGPTDIHMRHINGFNGFEGGLTVNPSNPNHAIVTGETDGYQTFDGGKTWVALSSKRVDNGAQPVPGKGDVPRWTTRGIDQTCQDGFAVNPFNLNHYLAGHTDMGLFESFDAGESWTRLNYHRRAGYTGFFHENLRLANCYSVAFDPHNQGILLAGMSSIHDLRYQGGEYSFARNIARYINIAGSGVNNIRGYIMKRNSNGVWAQATIKLDNTQLNFLNNKQTQANIQSKTVATDIVFDPHNRGVVYASVYGLGALKSTDSGSNWYFINNGITPQINRGNSTVNPLPGIFSRRMTLGKDGKTLFLELTSLRTNSNTGSIWQNNMIGQVYYLDITTDNTTWMELNRPNYDNPNLNNTSKPPGLNGIDKCKNGNIYAAPVRREPGFAGFDTSYNGGNVARTEGGGAYVSTDNGNTWRQIFDERYYVEDIKVSSRNPNVLFLTTHNGVYSSTKGKYTTSGDWVPLHDTRIGGYGHRTFYKIWEIPNDPTRILVSTMGGGTWSLLIPQAVLDILYPGIDNTDVKDDNQEN